MPTATRRSNHASFVPFKGLLSFSMSQDGETKKIKKPGDGDQNDNDTDRDLHHGFSGRSRRILIVRVHIVLSTHRSVIEFIFPLADHCSCDTVTYHIRRCTEHVAEVIDRKNERHADLRYVEHRTCGQHHHQ